MSSVPPLLSPQILFLRPPKSCSFPPPLPSPQISHTRFSLFTPRLAGGNGRRQWRFQQIKYYKLISFEKLALPTPLPSANFARGAHFPSISPPEFVFFSWTHCWSSTTCTRVSSKHDSPRWKKKTPNVFHRSNFTGKASQTTSAL